ncbi:MAG: flavodoxin family protein [Desulforudis sp.]|nr:flavodoxin family protein [Clostridia bacterium]MDQ7790697.1 flavodoxin family protein [Clostridia bacterium]RJX21102.1 MAG: flavodoxin family protein [Desulforudis sp.]
MLILALNGSPHKNGNTAKLLRMALAEAEQQGAQTEFLQVSEAMAGLKQVYCVQCSTPCKGVCYEGTLLGEMLDTLRQADGMVIGSPVYFGTVSAQLKSFWDKTRKLRKDLALLNVVGGCVVSGGSRFGGQETTMRALQDMMLVQGMTVVGDGFTGDDAGHIGACAKSPVDSDPEVDQRVRILARRVCQVAHATQEIRALSR